MESSSKRIWTTSDKSEAPLKKRHSMKTWGKKSRKCSCTWVPCVQETCTWWQYTYHYPCQDMQDLFSIIDYLCLHVIIFSKKNIFQNTSVQTSEKCTTHTKTIYIYKVCSKESPETKQICIVLRTLISTQNGQVDSGIWNPGPGARCPDPGTRIPGARRRNLNPQLFLSKNKHI